MSHSSTAGRAHPPWETNRSTAFLSRGHAVCARYLHRVDSPASPGIAVGQRGKTCRESSGVTFLEMNQMKPCPVSAQHFAPVPGRVRDLVRARQ